VLMGDAGMNYRQILASLTTAPATLFGVSDLGRIVVGTTGDLTVLKFDPARDIRALADVAYTIRGGKIIYQALGKR
jgi:imidazolonepropionase-like amidohydrolase